MSTWTRGKDMKKYFIIALCTLTVAIPDAFAAKWRMGSSERCFVDIDGKNKFYYCGSQSKGCAGHLQLKKSIPYWYNHGGTINDGMSGKNWICCSNKGSKWVLNPGSKTKIGTKTFDDGGTCNYTITIDGCGQENHSKKDTQCAKPTNCPQGQIQRNGKCIAPCPTDQGYESTASDVCIECPTTLKGGVYPEKTNDAKSGSCIKCNESAELFDYKTGKCVAKADIETQYSNAAFQKCWECGTNEEFRICVEAYSGANANVNDWSVLMNFITDADAPKDEDGNTITAYSCMGKDAPPEILKKQEEESKNKQSTPPERMQAFRQFQQTK